MTTDVLISLVPEGADTVGLFDDKVFDQMKPGSVFINVGRGLTVNETALVDALENGRLRVAVIDVTQNEPLPQDSPLGTAKNLVVPPHIDGKAAGGRAAYS
ncbi:NAD(P)-dependent oxidoreductase [Paenarthrobacter sp. NPDC090520]|uniref:NAD(P)-dependent oxidoreductase n=1 Tax=Paenarthrobacter sp. NPDC090520 TaxID=3364382 RepID=UPI003807BC35